MVFWGLLLRGKAREEKGRRGERNGRREEGGEKTGKEGITMGFSLPKVNLVTSLVVGNHTPRYCSMFKAYARNSVQTPGTRSQVTR